MSLLLSSSRPQSAYVQKSQARDSIQRFSDGRGSRGLSRPGVRGK